MRPSTPTWLRHAEDADGYPRMEFEAFYQQGLACYAWGLPHHLVRKSFQHLCATWSARGHSTSLWQIRAFLYGLAGRGAGREITRRAPPGYMWPEAPDSSWQLVICAYPDGSCDLDFAHPVSRRFLSEEHDFFDLPSTDPHLLNRTWFEAMGFEVMTMSPTMHVSMSRRGSHLAVVRPER